MVPPLVRGIRVAVLISYIPSPLVDFLPSFFHFVLGAHGFLLLSCVQSIENLASSPPLSSSPIPTRKVSTSRYHNVISASVSFVGQVKCFHDSLMSLWIKQILSGDLSFILPLCFLMIPPYFFF
eukprot:TRINITY_DN4397_c0_g2_i1.p1 TRINITY_DN4397_c0_g2~~TRINITY_DN4397_c0_g2_i1.p1  ORF type:complete len:124 (+),score=8.05 TRINITY_DN4397_c0_g2_i1:15-386(+)